MRKMSQVRCWGWSGGKAVIFNVPQKAAVATAKDGVFDGFYKECCANQPKSRTLCFKAPKKRRAS